MRASLVPGAVEMRRRQPADAAADDDQIVIFASRGDRASVRPEIAIAQRVRGLETARMIAAQPGQRRRIIAGGILRGRALGRGHERRQEPAGDSAAGGDGDAIDKVAPGDGAFHVHDLV